MKDQPVASYAARVELAKTIGTVRPDKGRFMIDIFVDGERYKLRHLPVVGGGWLPYRDEQTATEVLTMIRATIATTSSPRWWLPPSISQNSLSRWGTARQNVSLSRAGTVWSSSPCTTNTGIAI